MIQLGSGSKDESKFIHEQAARSIAYELYGDVVDRLYEIRTLLYESGPRYDCKVTNLVQTLMDDLELRDRI